MFGEKTSVRFLKNNARCERGLATDRVVYKRKVGSVNKSLAVTHTNVALHGDHVN